MPDHRLEASPLFGAVRATIVSEEELAEIRAAAAAAAGGGARDDADDGGDGGDDGDGGEAPLLRPIRDEQRARAKMAELIGAHLARYATTAEEDERAICLLYTSPSPRDRG